MRNQKTSAKASSKKNSKLKSAKEEGLEKKEKLASMKKEKSGSTKKASSPSKSSAKMPTLSERKDSGSSIYSKNLHKNMHKESETADAVCREVACEGLATTAGYCRLHYIKNWKKIKRKELILKEKKLNQYIEELVAKYPDKYIEAIRQDLASDKDFAKVIYDLDLDEGVEDFDVEGGESVDSLIDSIKRDFEDEGEF